MRHPSSIVGFLVALPAVQGAAFAPSPTSTSPAHAVGGISLGPTNPPSAEELRKRQTNLNPETCGWIDGVYSLAVTCGGSHTCMLYTAGSGMVGCCDSTNTIDCGWATSCIDAAAYKTAGCGSDCLLDPLIQKCTNSAVPYCATWTFPSDNVVGYGCVSYSDTSTATVLQRATDDLGATTSITLATVVANPAITNTSDDKIIKKAKKLAIGVIVGIVVVALFVICCIAVGILFCLKKKKKKQHEIAASAQAMAAVHATRPQSQFPPPQQSQFSPPQQQYQYPAIPPQLQAPPHMQMQQPSLFNQSLSPQNPASTAPSYFPPGQQGDKPGVYMSVHEYATTPVSPPVSSPPTPAPVYAQPHPVSPPPMPGTSPLLSQAQGNAEAYEVDAVSVPHVPGQVGPVHEIGSGK